MGQLITTQFVETLKVINCEACAKYVCNAMHIHSKCSECCECDFETEEIDTQPQDSNLNDKK